MTRERRRHKRFPLEMPVRFRIVPPSQPGNASAFQPARLQNLSEGGVRLLTNTVRVDDLHILHPTPLTSEQCEIDLETVDQDPPLKMRARVAWYDRTGQDAPFSFQAGLQFIRLSREQKREIVTCVKRIQEDRC